MILTAGGSGELLPSLLLFGRAGRNGFIMTAAPGWCRWPMPTRDLRLFTGTIVDVSDEGMRGVVNVRPEAKFGVVIVQPEVLKLRHTHHPAYR